MDLFTKPIHALTKADVERLIEERYPETDTVELKRTLPSSIAPDPWLIDQSSIGDKARNEILQEVVAFANAYGGHLVLGIAETQGHPHCAENICPLPECADLANRLRLSARDCIEPQLPVLEVEGVSTESDGSGVVVIRVPQSRNAPHRLKPTRHCYIRRADRTEKMTMREIQDLTLQRERGLARVEQVFHRAHIKFEAAVNAVLEKTKSHGIGIRATLVPVNADLYIDKVYNNPELQPIWGIFEGALGNTKIRLDLPDPGGGSRPILGGVRFEYDGNGSSIIRELHRNGFVEFVIIKPVQGKGDTVLFPEWALGLTLNALLTAHRFRENAGASGAEYALDVEVYRHGGRFTLGKFGGTHPWSALSEIEENPLTLPRLSLGDGGEIHLVMRRVARDLFEAAGTDLGDAELSLDLSKVLHH